MQEERSSIGGNKSLIAEISQPIDLLLVLLAAEELLSMVIRLNLEIVIY